MPGGLRARSEICCIVATCTERHGGSGVAGTGVLLDADGASHCRNCVFTAVAQVQLCLDGIADTRDTAVVGIQHHGYAVYRQSHRRRARVVGDGYPGCRRLAPYEGLVHQGEIGRGNGACGVSVVKGECPDGSQVGGGKRVCGAYGRAFVIGVQRQADGVARVGTNLQGTDTPSSVRHRPAVELLSSSRAIQLQQRLLHFLVQGQPVLRPVRAIDGLNRQFAYALQARYILPGKPVKLLDQGDAVIGIARGLVHSPHLGEHSFGNSQTRSVIARAVNTQA